MNLTTNLGLGKPLVGENYDVTVFNTNADTIDAAVDALNDRKRINVTLAVNVVTDANGYATFNHGAPFTPRAVQINSNSAAISLGVCFCCDQITATQVRGRFMNWSAGGLLISQGTGPVNIVSYE